MKIAGFPSPADEYGQVHLSITELLAPRPHATFFVRVSEPIAGKLREGDILVIDRSLKPRHNQWVLAVVRGKFSVRRIEQSQEGEWFLVSLTSNHRIQMLEEDHLWGVISYVIHKQA